MSVRSVYQVEMRIEANSIFLLSPANQAIEDAKCIHFSVAIQGHFFRSRCSGYSNLHRHLTNYKPVISASLVRGTRSIESICT